MSRYLFTRLAQLGVKSLHGVPGDFNLASLDALKHSGMNWVGNCVRVPRFLFTGLLKFD